jgi:hypothetical protein
MDERPLGERVVQLVFPTTPLGGVPWAFARSVSFKQDAVAQAASSFDGTWFCHAGFTPAGFGGVDVTVEVRR